MITPNATNVDGFQLVSLPSHLHLPHPSVFHLSVYLSAISISVSVCVCTCVCEWSRDGVQTGARLSPWVHSTYSADAVRQHISAIPWERGREEEREGKEMAHLHQSIPSSPSQLVSFYKHYRTVFLSTWVTIPIIRLWFSVIFCTNININIIFILKFDLYLYSAVFILY